MGASYRVEHDTEYTYPCPVATSQHVAYVSPRELTYQHVRQHSVKIEPAPASISQRTDYFGNIVDQFQILKPHSKLRVLSVSLVDVRERRFDGSGGGAPWEEVGRQLDAPGVAIPPEVTQFVPPSPYVPLSTSVAAFAEASFPPGRPLVDGAIDLMHRIHERFAFDASATAVTTPLTRVLEEERGVCQDFAHVAIACLRSLGLAARYVSGYLLTDPPPGQPRLVGADASHAWFSAYCPEHGWIDLDPTNDVVVGTRHVTVAWGRDYGDVSPLRGVLLGGAGHTLTVGVNVVPFEEVSPSEEIYKKV
jgi:transglutaminase-like putative cysteine protease